MTDSAKRPGKFLGRLDHQQIERVSPDRPLPLSLPQQRLWLLDQLRPEDPSYSVALALDLTGRLVVPALSAALGEMMRRHEILRTRFPEQMGKGSQIVDPHGPLPLPVVDVGGGPAARRGSESRGRSPAEVQRPFDLVHGPVIRALLFRLGEQRHQLVLTLHHIVCDAWSIDRLLGELAMLYGAFRARRPALLAELPIRYADYAVWLHRRLESGELELQLDYWRQRLADSPEVQDLPLDRPRPARRSPRGSRVMRYLPSALRTRLAELGRQGGDAVHDPFRGPIGRPLQLLMETVRP